MLGIWGRERGMADARNGNNGAVFGFTPISRDLFWPLMVAMHHVMERNSNIRRRLSVVIVIVETPMSPQKPSTYLKSEDIDIRRGKCFHRP